MDTEELEKEVNNWYLENVDMNNRKTSIQYRKEIGETIYTINIENMNGFEDEYKAALRSSEEQEKTIDTLNSPYSMPHSLIERVCYEWMKNDKEYIKSITI